MTGPSAGSPDAGRAPEEISDPADPRVGDFRQLNDPAARRRVERDGGFFIVEGTLAVERLCEPAVAARWQPRSLLVAPAQWPRLAPQWRSAFPATPVLLASPPVLAETVGFRLHRGVVASVTRPEPLSSAAVLAAADPARPVVVAEGLVDHENVGALFRNAAAFGAAAVLLDDTCADPLYRRAVRVSMGHVLAVPFAAELDIHALLATVRAAGRTVVALTPSGSTSLWDVPLDVPVALTVGSEGPGLTPGALDAADLRAAIPMAADVDSLNVATAAAVALAACTRARPAPR